MCENRTIWKEQKKIKMAGTADEWVASGTRDCVEKNYIYIFHVTSFRFIFGALMRMTNFNRFDYFISVLLVLLVVVVVVVKIAWNDFNSKWMFELWWKLASKQMKIKMASSRCHKCNYGKLYQHRDWEIERNFPNILIIFFHEFHFWDCLFAFEDIHCICKWKEKWKKKLCNEKMAKFA